VLKTQLPPGDKGAYFVGMNVWMPGSGRAIYGGLAKPGGCF